MHGTTYVLTTDNQLWATGLYGNLGTNYYPGWSGTDNKTTFVKILDDVAYFDAAGTNTRTAILQNGKAYGWGLSYEGANGMPGTTAHTVPTEYTLPADIGGINNIAKLKSEDGHFSYILTKTGKVFQTGRWFNGGYVGGHPATSGFSEYTYNLTLGSDETISNVVPMGAMNAAFLTSKGRIFGYGNAKYLGIGSPLNDSTPTRELTGISDVEQLVAGNGFYVAVKKDGTVWGTGSNQYGILGRWIGIDRKSPNSRYKTAFEWVECPELEI